MSALRNSITWLETSPMQRMSLGSRELFHSDFLSWLFEEYPRALAHVFDLTVKECKVAREEQNIDLVVRDGETPVLIVENKVKSYPDFAQLQRYSTRFPDVDKRYLLTLVPPSFAMPKGWKTVLYKDLAVGLQRWFEASHVSSEHRQYVVDYMTLVDHLATVAEECFDPVKIRENNFWFQGNRIQFLEKVGFSQTLQKFQAMAFRDYLKQAVPAEAASIAFPALISNDDAAPEEHHVKVWSALFNNTPCVTLEPVLADLGSEGLRFEIQIQGQQYRRLVAGPPLRNVVSRTTSRTEKSELTWACLEASGADSWLFGRERTLAPDGNRSFMLDEAMMRSKMRSDLCFYKPDVVYQYIDIAHENDLGALSLKTLPLQISRDIELAFGLLRHTEATKNSWGHL
ncbi:hypothetical protein GCM10016455_28380 [Aliiroseovarius zhejiangensis]|uniref:PD-(D/E)XK nuclease superfamily protein n=1 Tax=Aliiroseovarius zhejiangensis TaxID=1632025 RepID=A0ABQ3J6Y0_9RHOB|nr:hypothetical protein [Aliiroseovarius zhejiangensis]GHF05429.1 hypothetical protein GCM10016455_28380 [Aliiroseovarius zhejiangensis]